MDENRNGQEQYIREVLEAYRRAPGTMGVIRRHDRLVAAQLHSRGVPIEVAANAFILAAARRMARPADAIPLGPIRSLAYYLPVIEEVLHTPISPNYFEHLRRRLANLAQSGKV